MDIQDEVFAQHRKKYKHLSDADYVLFCMQDRCNTIGVARFVKEAVRAGITLPVGFAARMIELGYPA